VIFSSAPRKRAQAERDFLLARHQDRPNSDWIGAASDSLVSVAFGLPATERPHDAGDLWRCYATVQRMPEHLRTPEVRATLERWERRLGREDVQRASAHAGWTGWPR